MSQQPMAEPEPADACGRSSRELPPPHTTQGTRLLSSAGRTRGNASAAARCCGRRMTVFLGKHGTARNGIHLPDRAPAHPSTPPPAGLVITAAQGCARSGRPSARPGSLVRACTYPGGSRFPASWASSSHTSRTSARRSIALAVQLRDPALPMPQTQPEHVAVEGKRPIQVPYLHRYRADPSELKSPGHAGLLRAPAVHSHSHHARYDVVTRAVVDTWVLPCHHRFY